MIPTYLSNPRPQQTYASRASKRLRQNDLRANSYRWIPAFLGLALCSGIPGAILSVESEWYESLEKPLWNPPRWVFGVAWSAVHICAGFSAWRAWRARTAMLPWAAQWCCNSLSMPVLYLGQSPFGAFILIAALLLSIYWGAWCLSERDISGTVAITPYLLWVSIDATLLFLIWDLNK